MVDPSRHARIFLQGAESLRANKLKLKQLYGDAKALGADVNQSRANINALKSEIERSRLESGMTQVCRVS